MVLYNTARDHSLGALLAQENAKAKKDVLYYLSRTLVGPEERYRAIKNVLGTVVRHLEATPLPSAPPYETDHQSLSPQICP